MASARPRRALRRRADFCVVWPLLHPKTLSAEALDNTASLGGSLRVAREQRGAFADLRRLVDPYKALVLCAAPRPTRFVKLERFGALHASSDSSSYCMSSAAKFAEKGRGCWGSDG